jgi:hypothetical protein
MASLDLTKEAIRERFNIDGDFNVLCQLPNQSELYSIQNDLDLRDSNDAVAFFANRTEREVSPTNTPVQEPICSDGNRSDIYQHSGHSDRRKKSPQPIFMTQVN